MIDPLSFGLGFGTGVVWLITGMMWVTYLLEKGWLP